MTPKFDKPVATEKVAPEGKVWVRFAIACIHDHKPFQPGDEICVDSHWADSIEAIGSGHRITHQPKE